MSALQGIELVSTVLGLAYVVLLTREVIWAWPAGILGAALACVPLWEEQFFHDFWLNLMYVALGIYGWWEWGRKNIEYGVKNMDGGVRENEEPVPEPAAGASKALPIRLTPGKAWLAILFLGGGLSLLLGWSTSGFSDISYGDGFTSAFGVIGTYMQAKKWLENWLLWIVVDGVAAGLYFWKELYFFAGQYLVFMILAAYGFYHWKQWWNAQQKSRASSPS
jgi:nicotinamide mononucleotide transporter